MAEIYKDIHIGSIIKQLVHEFDIQNDRILNFFDKADVEIEKIYQSKSLDTIVLLQWSKLLSYDLFRLYSNHLILYHGISIKGEAKQLPPIDSHLQFSKNLYTPEVVEFILELIQSKKMSTSEVMTKYNIPKTTLYRWLKKFK